MEVELIIQIVKENYGLRVDNIEKIKNVYKINCSDKVYCLKIIKYEFPHFIFILSAIKHLQNNGFATIPQLLIAICGQQYIRIGDNYAYLTKWINAREANYDNPIDIMMTCQKMAELHLKSEGFFVSKDMKPRIGWLKWIETYNTRIDEIVNFKKLIENKEIKTEFDNIYLKAIEEEIERGKRSVNNLMKSDYIMEMSKEIDKKGFCHHDLACHNVLIEENNKINVIDFDYCILDSHLHDLSSLLMRRMKNGKWSIEDALFIIDSYSSIYPLRQNVFPIMAAFLEFPQDYWQIGIQYYWEKQPWGEEFFIKKLNKYLEDRDMRQEFIDDFKYIKY